MGSLSSIAGDILATIFFLRCCAKHRALYILKFAHLIFEMVGSYQKSKQPVHIDVVVNSKAKYVTLPTVRSWILEKLAANVSIFKNGPIPMHMISVQEPVQEHAQRTSQGDRPFNPLIHDDTPTTPTMLCTAYHLSSQPASNGSAAISGNITREPTHNVGSANAIPSTASSIKSVTVVDLYPQDLQVSFWQAELNIHVYREIDIEPEHDILEAEEGDDVPAFEQWRLPHKSLQGLWESIEVSADVKARLLGYCDTSIAFSEAGVDNNVISWNRMILMHGPPGTGKTTLCRALANKAYIRSCHRYKSGLLLDINAHSLFSKWFRYVCRLRIFGAALIRILLLCSAGSSGHASRLCENAVFICLTLPPMNLFCAHMSMFNAIYTGAVRAASL